MLHTSNSLREGNPLPPLLERVVTRLFAAADARAARRGWQIEDLGLRGRRYRDPRFTLLSGCPAHAGPDGTACTHCGARFFKDMP